MSMKEVGTTVKKLDLARNEREWFPRWLKRYQEFCQVGQESFANLSQFIRHVRRFAVVLRHG